MMNSGHSESAVQMLLWAIEEIAKTGNKNAEHHARLENFSAIFSNSRILGCGSRALLPI
jgi:hypothetical protein